MARVELYRRGFSVRRATLGEKRKKGGGRRGRISGKISAASFRRLREYVIRHECDGDCWGITLTVPGIDNLGVDDFRRGVHLLSVWCSDNDLPLVWRVELQRRGMPHLHCVAYCDVCKCLGLFAEWFRILEGYEVVSVEQVSATEKEIVTTCRAYVDGASHAVYLERLDGSFGAYRYLVAHMSKGKREQLGYAGRQWGVVCRKRFREVVSDSVLIGDTDYYDLLRWIRRWTRRRVLARNGCSWWVSDPAVLRRMLDYKAKREPRKGVAVGDVFARGSRPLWLYSWFGLQWISSFDFLQAQLILNDTLESAEKCIIDVTTVLLLYDPESQSLPF